MKKIHNNTVEYAKDMLISLNEYESGFYGANGSSKYIPLRYYRNRNNMVLADGSLDPKKVEDNFFNQIVRILDWISIKNYSVLKLYGLGDLFPEDKDYQLGIRKAVYKVLNEYQRFGIDTEVRNPVSINADVTAEIAVGAYLTSADFTGSEGWNAINRLSIDKWELGDDGLPYYNGATVDIRNRSGDSWFKTALSKISSNDPLDIPTVLFMNRTISEHFGGGDLATDITEVPTSAELTSESLQAKYSSGTGIFLSTERITLKLNPVGANERKAHANETIYVSSVAPAVTEKIQFVDDNVVVLSQNATVLDIFEDITIALQLLNNNKAPINAVLLRDGSNDMVDNYDPVRDLQVATLRKLNSVISNQVALLKGSNATKTIAQLEESLLNSQSRIADLENAEIIDNNIAQVNFPFIQPNTFPLATFKDQKGDILRFTKGSAVVINFYEVHDSTHIGSALVVSGDTQSVPVRINRSPELDIVFNVKIDDAGLLTATDLNPADMTFDTIGVSTLIQNPLGFSGVSSKQDLDAERSARQQADNLKLDKTLAVAIDGVTDIVQLLGSLQSRIASNVAGINNLSDRVDFKANTSLNNIELGAQTEQQILGSGLDGKLILIPKTSLLSKTLTITYSDGTTQIVKVG